VPKNGLKGLTTQLLTNTIFFFSHYIYHSRTYDREHSIEQAVSLLKNSMKNSIETEKDFYKHQVRLNDFGQSVQHNAEWVSAEEVYLKVTDDIAAEKEGTLCLACGNFFKKGFADASSENAMYLLQKYIGRLDAVSTGMQGKGNGEELYGYAILWSMLCVWSEAADEMELLHFLNWFLNFGHRSKENVFGGGTAISQDRLGRQSLMLLLILERWLDANTPSERKTLDCIIQVWETGKVVLFHDDEFWGKLYLMYSEMNQKEYRIFEDYQLYLERFRRGVTEGMSQTIVQSLVMSL
ncbi:MAG: hypothetical protein LUC90_05070, partial [Lachnospiraceae bacterium]|nr:hypothetical protein [Lachnospiraceae bacterium]